MNEKKKWNELSPKSQKVLSLTAFLVFLLFSVFLLVVVGIPIVKHAKNPDAFRAWIDGMGVWGKVAYVGMNVLQVLVAVIPGGPLEVAGGYAFGHFEAMVLSTIGMGIGSALVFLLVRYLGYPDISSFPDSRNPQGFIGVFLWAYGNKVLNLYSYCNLSENPCNLGFHGRR